AAVKWNPTASSSSASSSTPDTRATWAKSFQERTALFNSKVVPKPSEVRAAQTVSVRSPVSDVRSPIARPNVISGVANSAATPSKRGSFSSATLSPEVARSFSSATLSPEVLRTSMSQPPRTPSPFKSIAGSYLNPDSPDPTIVLNMDKAGGSLAKVYGTILQPTETLASFVCSGCGDGFPPDTTIYPSLTNSKEFFCRPCFELNGGSRGLCQSCGREVLRLKAEGGFVENSGRVWHSKCFRCEGCGREIGTRPMVDVLGRPCCDDCFDDCLKRGRGSSARTSRNPSPASKAVGMTNAPKSPRPGSGEATLSPPGNPGGLRKSSSQPGLSETHPVVEELARRIGSSPSRKETREPSPAPRATPRRDNGEADDRPSPFQRSITERLAALSSPPTFSPRDAVDALPPPPSNGTPKRFAAADFGAPPLPKATTNSAVSSTLSLATASPRSPSRSPLPGTTRELPETPAAKNSSTTTTPTQSKPRDSLSSVNRTASGLLTPGSTPTQSPMGTPPARVLNITSPPGSASRIPSLRSRHSVASISTPPRPGGSPGITSTVTTATTNTPTTQFGATPSRLAGGGLAKQDTPSRIPSVSSPRVQPSASSSSSSGLVSTSSPNNGQTPTRSTHFKSSLATIAASPSSSPASTLVAKEKPKRPSVTIPLNAEETGDDEERCEICKDLLYNMWRGGRFVSVPVHEEGQTIKRYHAECFRCETCGEAFAEVDGAASFVRYEGGVRHLECTPTKHIQTFKHPAYEPLTQLRDVNTTPAKPTQSARGNKPPARPASMYASTSGIPRPNFASHQAINSVSSSVGAGSRIPAAPRFGSVTVCPGCQVSVSPMERGIVPGPAATKWHAPCLVCGGREHSRRVNAAWKARDEVKGPGCGKKLDSAAKGDVSLGVLWCRDCWDVTRAQPGSPGTALSPTQSSSNSIFPSLSRPGSSMGINSNVEMGTTTLARQMSRSGAASPVRRPFMFPAPSSAAAISEQDVIQEGGSATQYLGGRISPLKNQDTGSGSRNGSPVRPQYSGVYGQGLRSVTPVRRQFTGATSPPVGMEAEAQPLAIQYTGGGVPVTRQLTTSRRPKSALGTRNFVSQKSIDEGRGMFLVRQMTGQASNGEDQS
ncbi:hypothetical protein FRC01_001631, partial [Tulasnella sp. 417]